MVCGVGFREWLHFHETQAVEPSVLAGYERAFQTELQSLINRTKSPELRQAFQDMQSCPVKDAQGRCRTWTDYILSALLRWSAGNRTIDLEDALQMIAFHMLSPVGERGQRRKSLFDFDEDRPFDLRQGNPLQALFKIYLQNDLRSIFGHKIKRLRTIQRPKGTLSIGSDPNTVSPEEIPGRQSGEEDELIGDIMELLRRKSTPDLDLVALFKSILRGEGTRHQRQFFGHSKADEGRRIIVATIRQYARQTENHALLRLLHRIENPEPRQPRPPKPPPKPKPKLPPDEQDFRSIVDVMERHGRRVGSLILGKARRRWLERKPRDPSSPYANRLADVLAQMVAAGVIERMGVHYVPGPRYSDFLPQNVLQNQ